MSIQPSATQHQQHNKNTTDTQSSKATDVVKVTTEVAHSCLVGPNVPKSPGTFVLGTVASSGLDENGRILLSRMQQLIDSIRNGSMGQKEVLQLVGGFYNGNSLSEGQRSEVLQAVYYRSSEEHPLTGSLRMEVFSEICGKGLLQVPDAFYNALYRRLDDKLELSNWRGNMLLGIVRTFVCSDPKISEGLCSIAEIAIDSFVTEVDGKEAVRLFVERSKLSEATISHFIKKIWNIPDFKSSDHYDAVIASLARGQDLSSAQIDTLILIARENSRVPLFQALAGRGDLSSKHVANILESMNQKINKQVWVDGKAESTLQGMARAKTDAVIRSLIENGYLRKS